MPRDIVLVDFENTQPEDLHLLAGLDCLVRVFYGINQRTAPTTTAEALRPLGGAVEYVRGQCAGKNSLDFVLTFHLGQLTASHPTARFWIVSDDRDFQIVVRQARSRGIRCTQVSMVRPIVSRQTGASEHVASVIEYLCRPRTAKPGSVPSLRATIKNLLPSIDDAAVDEVLHGLKQQHIVWEHDGAIYLKYKFKGRKRCEPHSHLALARYGDPQ